MILKKKIRKESVKLSVNTFNQMSNMSSPCRKCTDRKLGCHDTCCKYIDYKEQRIGIARYLSGSLLIREKQNET